MAQQQFFAVCGIGRSGTSLVAQMLHSVGVGFGNPDAMSYSDASGSGWEHEIPNRIDCELLGHKYDPSWLNQTDGNIIWEYNFRKHYLESRAKDWIENEFQDIPYVGWKSLRTSFTVPFWDIVTNNSVKYIICFRSPAEVAQSNRIWGLSEEMLDTQKNYRLWFSFISAAITNSGRQNRFLVHYNTLMQEPDKVLLGLSKFIDNANSIETMRACIDNSKQHHFNSDLHSVPTETANLYLCVKELFSEQFI